MSAFIPLGQSKLGQSEGLDPSTLRFSIDSAAPPEPTQPVLDAWAELCAANARLHNGDVLSFVEDPSELDTTRTIALRRESYQRLTIQTARPDLEIRPRVWQISVTGMLVAGGSVLLGKRSSSTRLYGGMWELSPAGGLDVGPDLTEFDGTVAVEQLRTEAQEEFGDRSPFADQNTPRIIGLSPDQHAGSCDVVVRVNLDRQIDLTPTSWEYDALGWFPIDALPSPMIEPSASVLGWLSERRGASG